MTTSTGKTRLKAVCGVKDLALNAARDIEGDKKSTARDVRGGRDAALGLPAGKRQYKPLTF
jgi:hypothetical protein